MNSDQIRAASRPPRAALYCRVSTAGQEDNASLATQEEACRTYAAEHGWTVTAAFREVHTGVDLFERPQLALLREAMRHRQVDAVICYSTDRLSRDPVHLGLVQYEATYYGIELTFVTDTYDTSLEGQMLAMVRGIAGRIEYERLKDRTRRGMQGRLAKGLPLVGNKPPYGYQWADAQKSRLQIDEDEAVILREAFRRVAIGDPVRRLVRELNERGVPSATGKGKWVSQSLVRMLRNPVYKGKRIALQAEYFDEHIPGVGRRKKYRRRDDTQTITMDGVAPHIVTDDVFEAVQVRLAKNKERSVRNNRTPTLSLLRGGIARCGYCGNALQAKRLGEKRSQYICHNRNLLSDCPAFAMETHLLDDLVWARVEEVLLNPDVVASQLDKKRAEGFDDRIVQAAEKRVRDAERKRDRLIRELANIDDDGLSDAIRAQIKEHQREVNMARDVLAELQGEQEAFELAQRQYDDLRTWLSRVAENLENLDYEGKRLALDALGVKVRLWATTHEPRYRISMNLAFLEADTNEKRSLVLS